MGQQGGLMGMMLPLAMFAAIFYFMIIRPQKKNRRLTMICLPISVKATQSSRPEDFSA